MFSLVVDDFGVECTGKDHAKHLTNALNLHCDITEDWTGEKYLGIDLDWDYLKRTVRLSMNHYTRDLLIKCNNHVPKKSCHSPHTNKLPTYGAKAQHTDAPDELPELNTIDTRTIQAIIGSLSCYGRVVDNKLLVTLSTIAMKTHSPTTFTRQEVHHLLDYVATCPDDGAMLRFSNM